MLLTSIASSILNTYDFQINEAHHNKKKDIPSGTALKIAGEIEKAIASSAKTDEGEEALKRTVPINAVRAGGIVGRHEVVIAGEEDMIEISHQSFSRKAFAMGAIRAVKYIYKKTGYFEMSDVLNLGSVLSRYVENEKGRQAKRGKYLSAEEDDLAEFLTN
jgi:4-hydroxy-tetrahydrodipicolinate reductase